MKKSAGYWRRGARAVLCAVTAACMLIWMMCACRAEYAGDPSADISFLLLGDSIADGVGAADEPSGQYGSLICEKFGFTLINDALSGDDTDDLLDKLQNDRCIIRHAARADHIGISIGGNNLLGVSTDRLILLAIQGADGRVANEILSKLDTDINRILARLRELNGSCKIWLQTVYNPFSGADSPLLSAVSGVTSSLAARARELYQKVAQKREAVCIVDVYDVFSKHAAKSHSRDYYSADGAHPSAMGNAAIADAYVSRMSGAGVICAEPSKTGDNLAADENALKKFQPIGEGAAVFADEGGVRLESAGAGGLAVIGQIPRDAIGIEFVAVADRELKAAAAGFAEEGEIAVFNTGSIFRIGGGNPARHRVIFADHADDANAIHTIDRICITAEEKATIQIRELRFVRAVRRG